MAADNCPSTVEALIPCKVALWATAVTGREEVKADPRKRAQRHEDIVIFKGILRLEVARLPELKVVEIWSQSAKVKGKPARNVQGRRSNGA
jgi:hypothetical protein